MTRPVALQLIEVTSDEFVEGLPRQDLWVAAASPEDALALVLQRVPEGWSAALLDIQVTPEEVAALKMEPGDVRKIR